MTQYFIDFLYRIFYYVIGWFKVRDFVRERFKTNLKKYRLAGKQAGLPYCKSAKKFAEYINVNYNTYIDYERKGNSPPLDILAFIAQALNVSVDCLLGLPDIPDISVLKFLNDLGIKFKIELKNDDNYYILYAPIDTLQEISVDYETMKEAISEFQELDITTKDTALKSYIFYKFITEYNELLFDDLHNTALQRNKILPYVKAWCDDLEKLSAIKQTGDFKAYFSFLHNMFDKQKEVKRDDISTWYYGFKEFRGGE